MFLLSQFFIFSGIVLMLFNVGMFLHFLVQHKYYFVGKYKANIVLAGSVFTMIVSFAVIYIIIFTLKIDSPWIGIILFGGSIFVTVVINWIFTLFSALSKRAFGISESLIAVIEARDPNLDGHSIHVQDLTMRIYHDLPLHEKRMINKEELMYAALFHDLGKLGVPEVILNKPGRLTTEEWDIMKMHPKMSVQILAPINTFDDISDWIMYHHERMDGKGYYGIKKEDIPLPARIIAVADTVSAITMKRSYKQAKTYEEAIDIIKEAAGSQLDEDIVNLFCKIPKKIIMECASDVEKDMRKFVIDNHGERSISDKIKDV